MFYEFGSAYWEKNRDQTAARSFLASSTEPTVEGRRNPSDGRSHRGILIIN